MNKPERLLLISGFLACFAIATYCAYQWKVAEEYASNLQLTIAKGQVQLYDCHARNRVLIEKLAKATPNNYQQIELETARELFASGQMRDPFMRLK